MEKARRGRVFLVGFMGSGKSSVGPHLARELGFRFVDLDAEIERKRGLTVAEIFEQDGEPEFRRLEALALREIGEMRDVVVATGGGTLTRWESRDFIQRSGTMVWLDAPLDVMLGRCRDGARRPLISTRERMEELLADRAAVYRAADLRVDTSGRDPAQAARFIAERLGGLLG